MLSLSGGGGGVRFPPVGRRHRAPSNMWVGFFVAEINGVETSEVESHGPNGVMEVPSLSDHNWSQGALVELVISLTKTRFYA